MIHFKKFTVQIFSIGILFLMINFEENVCPGNNEDQFPWSLYNLMVMVVELF